MTRVAVVTGAARGIGAGVVRQLAVDGWAIVAVDAADGALLAGYRLATKEQFEASVAAVPDPDLVIPVVADCRSLAAVRDAIDVAIARFGGLDAAVATAGIIAGGAPGWETDDETYEALMDVNVGAVRQLARAAVPALLARPAPRNGRFVAVASVAGHRGLRSLAVYCAAKHACVGFVRGLAADLRGTGVTANVVSPGSTDTSMLERTAELYDLDGTHHFAAHSLVDRLLAAEEVAAAVAWLCSRESSALHGSVISADGGMTT
ncbi:MAG: mycofactocin-coupled SDR family oxidoreductase [Egibacteraceae bacterium]